MGGGTEMILKPWPRFALWSNWKRSGSHCMFHRTFHLLTILWSEQFIGICVLNFTFEYNREWERGEPKWGVG
jgi:hypothetical protein